MVQGQMVTVKDMKDLVKSTLDGIESLESAGADTKFQLQFGFAFPGIIADLSQEQTKTILNKLHQAVSNFADGFQVSLQLSVLEDSKVTRELIEKTRGSYEAKKKLEAPGEEIKNATAKAEAAKINAAQTTKK